MNKKIEKFKKDTIKQIFGNSLRIISWIQLISLIVFLAGLFMAIWGEFTLGLKLLLTGLVSVLILKFVDWILKESINNIVDEAIKQKQSELTWQEKIEQKLKERQQKK